MRTSPLAALSVTLILSGCGAATSLNPFKSSAPSQPAAAQSTEITGTGAQRGGLGLAKDPQTVQSTSLNPYNALAKPAPNAATAPQSTTAVASAAPLAEPTAAPQAGDGLVRAGPGKTKDSSPFVKSASAAQPTQTAAAPVAAQTPSRWRNSRLNPSNWFGRPRAQATTATGVALPPQDPRPLVEQVVSMAVEPIQGGLIVRATGLPPTQGWWNGALLAQPVDDKGTLAFDFRMKAPLQQTAVSTPRSREVTVAIFVSDFDLVGVRQIVVRGAQTAKSSRR